ncbi:peptidase inhibitor family I36 protein [Shewanella baltica]|uniref:peptidase inhibitor family I36 protein n=1 Tax=Shewanella baltica TaxID=62322 RepID=UPI003CFC6D15
MNKSSFGMLFLCVSFLSVADNKYTASDVYICVLTPFNKLYAGVDIQKTKSQLNASLTCQNEQGEGSIFCSAKETKCIISTIVLNNQSNSNQSRSVVSLFSEVNQTGQQLRIDQSVNDFRQYNFNDKLSSFNIPIGWEVRFFKDKNYQGDYYTRDSGMNNATGFTDSISSMKILKKSH